MKKGFLSFAVAAFFLLSFISASLLLSSQKQDHSYESFRSLLVLEIASKRAFYRAESEAASQAHAAALASGEDPYFAVKAACFASAMEFESQMNRNGFAISFWCGSPSEQDTVEASGRMQKEGGPSIPAGASPLPSCEASFGADTLGKRLHFSRLGFSFYSHGLGAGKAVRLPDSFEVGF